MKINKKDFKYIERHEIYGDYCRYIEPIIDFMCEVGYSINGSDSIMEFVDNICYNGDGFVNYKGNLYISELAEDKEQLDHYDYFVDYGDKYILIPIEIE